MGNRFARSRRRVQESDVEGIATEGQIRATAIVGFGGRDRLAGLALKVVPQEDLMEAVKETAE